MIYGEPGIVSAIVQARCSSTRLPGKVLSKIAGKPMLALQLERVRRSRLITSLCVATSTRPDDNPIAELCGKLEVDCFRGNLEDVLDRFYRAALGYPSDFIVRLTADCPLCDAQQIDRVIYRAMSGGFDYVSNCLHRTFPVGLDTEVFTPAALDSAFRNATLPSEREHVTPYIYKHPELFTLENVRHESDLSHLRWTVDQPEDLAFVRAVYEQLYDLNPTFTMEDVLQLLKHQPELAKINAAIVSGQGYEKSLAEDIKSAELRTQ
jgi:spore coat polysaccharide biosynthesis protein SpsF